MITELDVFTEDGPGASAGDPLLGALPIPWGECATRAEWSRRL